MIWREKRYLLIVLGLLLAANVAFFFTYRVRYQSRLDALDTRLAQVEKELEDARNARVKAEGSLAGYRKVEGDVQQVFNAHWSTQTERLTALIVELKRLAAASSLIPPTYSFQQGKAERVSVAGSRGRGSIGANEIGIAFGVQGSYAQIRRLINLLELSQQFVIIEGIALSAGEGNNLAMNLQLKTLFREPARTGTATNQT